MRSVPFFGTLFFVNTYAIICLKGKGMSFEKKAYINDFNKKTYKSFIFRVRKDNESVLEKLDATENLNSYIRSLIEKDINPGTLTIKEIKQRILPILSSHSIHEVYLFGSYARGEAKSTSDVDIYCEHGDIKTFIQQGFLEDELEAALGKKVDLIFIGTKFNDYFKEQLETDKIRLC